MVCSNYQVYSNYMPLIYSTARSGAAERRLIGGRKKASNRRKRGVERQRSNQGSKGRQRSDREDSAVKAAQRGPAEETRGDPVSIFRSQTRARVYVYVRTYVRTCIDICSVHVTLCARSRSR